MVSRRVFIAGAACAATSARAAERNPVEWSDERAFASGPLASGSVARKFHAPRTPTAWPEDLALIGPRGPTSLRSWRGQTLLVALWAEWCAPCLAEMPALNRLHRKFGSTDFAILPIVTGSKTLRTHAAATQRLRRTGGGDLVTLVDSSATGADAMQRLAGSKRPDGSASKGVLPCLLIVDRSGMLRGRTLGLMRMGPQMIWETPQADDFIAKLRSLSA